MSVADCQSIRDRLLEGDVPVGPEIDQHVRTCSTCAELLHGQAELGQRLSEGAREQTPDFSFSALETALGQETSLRARLAAQSTKTRTLLSVSFVAVLALYAFVTHRHKSWLGQSEARIVTTLAVYALGIVFATRLALRSLAQHEVRRPARWLAIVALLAPFAFACWPVSAVVVSSKSFASAALTCFVAGAAFSAPFLLLLWALSREERPRWHVVLLEAAAAGLAANLILGLDCPITEPAHLIAGHGAIGLAWLAARSIARIRTSAPPGSQA